MSARSNSSPAGSPHAPDRNHFEACAPRAACKHGSVAAHSCRTRPPQFANPTGYLRIVGELRKLGIDVSATLVRNVLRAAGLPPATQRGELDWRSFLRQQAASTLACDFLTVDTVLLRRLYVLIFIRIGSRRIEYVACTSSPDGAWMQQQARNLLMDLDEHDQRPRLLIHDRDTKFSRAFDVNFQGEGMRVIRTPLKAPNANAHIERWVGSARRECLDRPLIFNRRQLEHVLRVYLRHYG